MRRITGNRPTSSYVGNSYASKGVQSYPDSDGDSSDEDDEESGGRKDRPISFFDPVSGKKYGNVGVYLFFDGMPKFVKHT